MNTRRVVMTILALALIAGLAACGKKYEPETGYTATDNLQILLDRVTRTLSGVNNPASAEAALPVLAEVSEEFDRLAERLPNLTESARAEMSSQAARAMPGLKDNARRINNSDGIDLLGPTMNELVNKLARLL